MRPSGPARFALDPELAAALAPLLRSAGPAPAVGDIAGRRTAGEALIDATNGAIPRPPDVEFTEHSATSSDGTSIPLRWYSKRGSARGPAVVYFHGGGYIQGRIAQFDRPIARYVSESDVPVLLVEYRLAPEHPFPAPEEDAYAALEWLHENADGLGLDRTRIAVMGDSAGAGLAASLAILARDRGGPAIARQLLVMPMLDDRTRDPDPELVPFASWTYDDNVTAWDALLGPRAGGDDVPPTAAPARLEDLRDLPPAYIEVGQLDIFRDEDLRYALALSGAGVPVEFHLWPGAIHEFDGVAPESDLARRVIADRVRILRSI